MVHWASIVGSAYAAEDSQTVLGIEGARFTLNGKPIFLLGFSYYGALGAPEEFIRHDLEDFQRQGFNWLRVWATWEMSGDSVSAVDAQGQPREPFLHRLQWLVTECDRRGLVVDVTLARGQRSPATAPDSSLPNFKSHQQAVQNTQWHQPLYPIFDRETIPEWFGMPSAPGFASDTFVLVFGANVKDKPRLLPSNFGVT